MSGSLAKILFICGFLVLMPFIGNNDIGDAGRKRRGDKRRKKQQKTTDSICEVQQPIAEKQAKMQTAATRPTESFYADSKFVELAELCKMGDRIAMIDMAFFFRDRCTKQLRELLDAYELQPAAENEDLLNTYLWEHPSESKMTEVYMMWLVRAALYGNEEAQLQIDRCPYYKQKAYIPYKMLTGEGRSFIKLWNSDSLREMGLIDIKRGCTDCSLSFNMKCGYFILTYVADYEPPDEDGFGAEWDYEDIYYDEFFCRIPTKSEEEISQQQMILEKAREAYWQNPTHDVSNRKYRRRLYNEG